MTATKNCCRKIGARLVVSHIFRRENGKQLVWPRFSFLRIVLAPVDQMFEGAVFQMLVQPPPLNLTENAIELLTRDRLVNESFPAGEALEIPFFILKLCRNAMLPEVQVLRQICLE